MTTKPLRILEVVDTLDAGGMEAQLVSLINRLDPAQFEFEVVCLRHAGVNAARLNPRVKVTTLDKADGFQLSALMQLYHKILRGSFDVIHTHNWAPLVYAGLGTAGGLLCSLFHGEHSQLNSREMSASRLLLRKVLYRFCNAVHTVSAGQKEELQEIGLSHKRLWPLVNGVDTERFFPLHDNDARNILRKRLIPHSEDEFWIGMVARFGAYKRHKELITAFESLSSSYPHVRLVLVGDGGPEKERVLRQVKSSLAQQQIYLAGYQTEPLQWYQAMNILVVPSANEGLSNATLEAMSCGIPVLSNTICGARELIGENEAGWIEDLSTLEKLTKSLHSVLQTRSDTLQKLGRSGRARSESMFSWHGMAHRYSEALRTVAH